MRSSKWPVQCAVVLLVAAGGQPVLGADPAMEKIVKVRHDNFEELGKAFKAIEREAKKRKPSLSLMQQYATEIDRFAKEQGSWFPQGSGPNDGFKTKAKAEVWTRPDEFQKIHDRFLLEAAKLKEVAFGSDAHALEAQVDATGEACSECHIGFRKKGGLFSLFGG